MPREPSTPRITLWRKLRRLGAVQLVDGLVALPSNARTKEQLEWLADEVVEADGEATVWIARSASADQERQLKTRITDAAAEEYQAVIDEADEARDAELPERRRTLERLRRELLRISQRDYFPPPEREEAHLAVDALAAAVMEEVP
jgi:hypothetical protein